MTDPIEPTPEVAAYIKSVIAAGVVIRSDDHNLNQSTSAQLRETQAALAASQADLTAMEKRLLERTTEVVELTRERDEARAEASKLRAHLALSGLGDAQFGSDAGPHHEHADGCEWPLGACLGHTKDTPGTPVPGHHEGATQQ
jgi:hypothetical protein